MHMFNRFRIRKTLLDSNSHYKFILRLLTSSSLELWTGIFKAIGTINFPVPIPALPVRRIQDCHCNVGCYNCEQNFKK